MAADMPDNNPPLQAWTCVKCGAALPAEAGSGELVTCGYCGTPFKLPTAEVRHGGISISGGSVFIGGDLIEGSKVITAANVTIPAETMWDEPATSENEGISIKAEEIQIAGDVVGSSVVEGAPPAPPIRPAAPSTPRLGWWKRVKHLFSN